MPGLRRVPRPGNLQLFAIIRPGYLQLSPVSGTTYSQTPAFDSYTQPQVSLPQQSQVPLPQQPQLATYAQAPQAPLPQDTYNGQFSAPQGAPPPQIVSASASYVEPRNPGSAASIPVAAGYEGPARRRFVNGPQRNGR